LIFLDASSAFLDCLISLLDKISLYNKIREWKKQQKLNIENLKIKKGKVIRMFQGMVKIVENQDFEGFFKMKLDCVEKVKLAKPGQFILIDCGARTFLKRPFSIHNLREDCFEILYKTVGKGTRALAKKRKEEFVNILGPLGQGFRIESKTKKIYLIGGGMGIAPLLFLANSYPEIEREVFIGASGLDELAFFARNNFRVVVGPEFIKIATEKGSYGHKGLVTDLLPSSFEEKSQIFACGPPLMLKEVVKIALKNNVPCQVSLEARMACGLGVCRGCVIKTKSGLKAVCKDGPIFKSQEVIWDD